jgi:hypothetical protein
VIAQSGKLDAKEKKNMYSGSLSTGVRSKFLKEDKESDIPA